MKLSVIMPVYSETESVCRIIEDISLRLKEHLLEIILIVASRSSDESKMICSKIATDHNLVRMIMQSERPGFGQAYREAFPHARGTHILMLDADEEFDLVAIPRMIDRAGDGADVVVGCRWIPGGGVEGYGLSTFFANRAFQLVLRLAFRTPLHDLTFGFKLLSIHVIRSIPWEGKMHELAMETTLKPLRFGYRVEEVPAFWTRRREGRSKNQSFMWRARWYLPIAWRILRAFPPPGTPLYAKRLMSAVR
ncbi:hypothetical protein A3F28_01405 [Candidatus Uhrbacteria bacterium RIFCSPHIGHO2_12_FULL_57_11]|uniref:Glycosyltransferase 2-like domain-containing protein n=3 Tax=Parcubacteria group TaxID=1794811 RepID=A0A1F7UHR3_9BACT|nr:MAG: hypothetical protein A2704_04695 [Candidatus Kaiserbacteria bacterium RIFCSPHIGHO2_01_FULL_54_36b]OGL72756.1 MAG: hypothetical protein A3D72_04295 [Candidatus Uhrbacteria bacterium RIFCSPHIGHO2_02_FULL_57_19]OGL77803.1 MAG: hypothetical protein A3F28_01405 [Candidatus Uhrbacteria bacterium RIFCSPHIGHO2_12_FULL_57_11]